MCIYTHTHTQYTSLQAQFCNFVVIHPPSPPIPSGSALKCGNWRMSHACVHVVYSNQIDEVIIIFNIYAWLFVCDLERGRMWRVLSFFCLLLGFHTRTHSCHFPTSSTDWLTSFETIFLCQYFSYFLYDCLVVGRCTSGPHVGRICPARWDESGAEKLCGKSDHHDLSIAFVK